MSEDDIRDGSLELGTELAKRAAPEIADVLSEFLPGVKLLAGLWSMSQQRTAARFIQGIARELGWDDGEMAATRLAEETADPIKRARVILGFREILETWDELACECITVLVADSLRGTRSNRDYQISARLLSELDAPLLGTLATVAQLYVELLDRGLPQMTLARMLAVDARDGVTPPLAWMAAMPINAPGRARIATAQRPIDVSSLSVVGAALERYGLGVSEGDLSDVTYDGYGGGTEMVFSRDHDEHLRALFRYLAPVRVRSKAG